MNLPMKIHFQTDVVLQNLSDAAKRKEIVRKILRVVDIQRNVLKKNHSNVQINLVLKTLLFVDNKHLLIIQAK